MEKTEFFIELGPRTLGPEKHAIRFGEVRECRSLIQVLVFGAWGSEGGAPNEAPATSHLHFFCGSFLRKGEVFAYVGRNQNLEELKNKKLAASLLHSRAGSVRSFAAIRKEAGRVCGSFSRKGQVFAYVGLIHSKPKGNE